jgi:hypothetical protein
MLYSMRTTEEVGMTLLFFILGAIFGGVVTAALMAMLFVSKRADENAVVAFTCTAPSKDLEGSELHLGEHKPSPA